MAITEKITPLRDKVLISEMDFGAQITAGGVYIPSANAKSQGIIPRWGKVWAVGEEQKAVNVGDWVLIEHGRWTRTIEVEENGSILEVRMVDNDAVIIASDEKPNDILRAKV